MPEFLSRCEAAEYLTSRGIKISKNTLQKMVTTGGGPVYQTFGGRALYTPANLDAWVDERISLPRRSSSEAA